MSAAAEKFSRLAALKPARPIRSLPVAMREPNEEDAVARLLGAMVASNHFGEHLAIRNWYSSPEFAAPSFRTLELLSHARDESFSRKIRAALENSEKWLFLDTETTGLAGGTGTYAFLIGLAWWDSCGLQVEQILMRDFTEEFSALQQLAQRIAERPVLVTFNGKSFDWPLLENRFTMTRSIATPKIAAHLDLLHPARALWKPRLGSVRLAELERQVLDAPRLGWCRDDDITSSLIPQFYFDYLRGGPVEPLAGVVRHNQMDLRGLAALFGKINEMLSESASELNEVGSLDLFGLSRFLQRRGASDRAQTACAKALELGLPAEFRAKASRELAQMSKQRGEHARAAEIWLRLAGDPHDGVHACEQLAIYYERHEKDASRAAQFAKLAIATLRRQRSGSRDPLFTARAERLERRFLQRLARLERKSRPSSRSQSRGAPPAMELKANSALW